MATLSSTRKLAALKIENRQEHPWSNLEQNSNVSRSQTDYITQVSENLEGGVRKKSPQDFSRTESCILGTLSLNLMIFF